MQLTKMVLIHLHTFETLVFFCQLCAFNETHHTPLSSPHQSKVKNERDMHMNMPRLASSPSSSRKWVIPISEVFLVIHLLFGSAGVEFWPWRLKRVYNWTSEPNCEQLSFELKSKTVTATLLSWKNQYQQRAGGFGTSWNLRVVMPSRHGQP